MYFNIIASHKVGRFFETPRRSYRHILAYNLLLLCWNWRNSEHHRQSQYTAKNKGKVVFRKWCKMIETL